MKLTAIFQSIEIYKNICYTIFVYATMGRREQNLYNKTMERSLVVSKIYLAIKDPKPRALIIHCPDPRFRTVFSGFIAEELGLHYGDFVLITVAGGPAALAHSRSKRDDFQYIVRQTRFFLGHFKSIQEIVFFGHQNCGFYKTINGHPARRDPEKRDLLKIAKISDRLKFIKVRAHYAKFTDENHAEITFEKIQ